MMSYIVNFRNKWMPDKIIYSKMSANNRDASVRIFPSPYQLAEHFAEELTKMAADQARRGSPFSIVLSGGSTPELLYSVIGDHFSASIDWEHIHFFWGDERCVSPESPESNYGMAWRTLLGRISIPPSNVHRIRGENEPSNEATRYSEEIALHTRKRNGLPAFDMIILGLGEDGHTASIFPSNPGAMGSDRICEVAYHPDTLQKRITLTGRVINNAGLITFIVTGRKKAAVIEKIINKKPSAFSFPASGIVPTDGKLVWMIDKEAASLL